MPHSQRSLPPQLSGVALFEQGAAKPGCKTGGAAEAGSQEGQPDREAQKAAGGGDSPEDVCSPAAQEVALDKKALLERIKFFESASQKNCPDSKEQLAAANEKLAKLQQAELDNKPVDEQVKKARKAVEACTKAKEKAEKEKSDLAAKIEELQEKNSNVQARIDKASEELEAAKQSLELVLKKHIEVAPAGNAASDATMDSAKMFAAMHDMVQLLAATNGVKAEDPGTTKFVEQLRTLQQMWEAMQGAAMVAQQPSQQPDLAQQHQQLLDDEKEFAEATARVPPQQQHEIAVEKSGQNATVAQPALSDESSQCDVWMDHVATLTGGSTDDLSEKQRAAAAAVARLQHQVGESIAKRLKVL